MKKVLALLFLSAACWLLPLFATAQNVKTHTVGPKESLSSIGRLYEVNGRVLAWYNKIDYDKGLNIGQVLKIPPKGTTMPVENKPVTTEIPKTETPVKTVATKTEVPGTPIYHKVAKKETLFHISTLYNKVPIEDLKKWNNLTSDAVTEGANLIVGYTKGTETKTDPVEKPVKEKPVVKEIEKTETVKQVKEAETNEPKMVNTPAKDFKGGVFKGLFESQNGAAINEDGTAGVFKSTSGWTDGKYYCLHNTAAPGTILKITNKANGKSVYAKVLDVIPDIKQNAGLLIRISNAASGELGAAENNFNCSINYSK